MDPNKLMRITLIDATGGVSVAVTPNIAPALVAALMSRPHTIEALLQATEALYRYASTVILTPMINRDRQDLLWRQGFQSPPATNPDRDAWDVGDRDSYRRARLPAQAGLLWIDLDLRKIRYFLPPTGLPIRGEVAVFDGDRYLSRSVPYVIGEEWDVAEIE